MFIFSLCKYQFDSKGRGKWHSGGWTNQLPPICLELPSSKAEQVFKVIWWYMIRQLYQIFVPMLQFVPMTSTKLT